MIYNFSLDEDIDFVRRFTIIDSAGDPVDLTGHTASMQIRRRITDANPLVSVTSATSNLSLEADGTLTIYLDETQVGLLGAENVYDVEIVAPGGKKDRPLQGKMFVLDEGYTTYGSISP